MPLNIPPELKKITQFIRRAEELDRDKSSPESRVVAYYCRQHAVSQGIPLATSALGKKCLGEILNTLETEKKAMSVFTKGESKLICRKFADKIFDNADYADRFGNADKNTAKSFYAAATFYEILQQFYPPSRDDDDDETEKSPDQVEEDRKRVYCKWKATEILKAIKEGRKPTPGGYGEYDPSGDESEGAMKDTGMAAGPAPGTGGGGGERRSSDGSSKDWGVSGSVGDGEGVPPASAPPITVGAGPYDSSPVRFISGGHDSDGEGTEVGLLGPPPAYPGDADANGEGTADVEYRPPLAPPAFQLPKAPTPASPPSTSSSKKLSGGIGGGMFKGFGRKSSNASNNSSDGAIGSGSQKVSKEALADAVELTQFALAALKGKNVELGATRLREALDALGR